MPSKSYLNNSQWVTIPLVRVGTPAQQQRWREMLIVLATPKQQRWKIQYPVNPRALNKGDIK